MAIASPQAGAATPPIADGAAVTAAGAGADASPAPIRAPDRKSRLLAGHKIVLEYDPPAAAPEEAAKPAPTPAGVDPALVARARSAYQRGTQLLFRGETKAAIASYRQSLADYPGYVAGYRGLGFAFAEAGDRADALDALHTYLRIVPGARDARLIQQRIELLQAP